MFSDHKNTGSLINRAIEVWSERGQTVVRTHVVTTQWKSLLALKLKPEIEKKAKENQIRTSENRVCQKSDKQKIDTKKELAKIASVSHDTIHKVQVIEEKKS